MRWRPGRSERRPSRSTARLPVVVSRSGRAAVTVRVHRRACRSRREGVRQVAPSRRPETTRSKPTSSARVAVSRSASPRPRRASRVLPGASRSARGRAARRTRARPPPAAVAVAGRGCRGRRGLAPGRHAAGRHHARRGRVHAEAVGPEVRVVGGHLLLGLQVRDRAVERGVDESDVLVGLAVHRLAPGPRRREQRRDAARALVDVDQLVGVGGDELLLRLEHDSLAVVGHGAEAAAVLVEDDLGTVDVDRRVAARGSGRHVPDRTARPLIQIQAGVGVVRGQALAGQEHEMRAVR